jgi:hypothetical protein
MSQQQIYVCEQVLLCPNEALINATKEWMKCDLFYKVSNHIKFDVPYTIHLKEESHIDMGGPSYGSELRIKFSLFVTQKCQGTSQIVKFIDIEDL